MANADQIFQRLFEDLDGGSQIGKPIPKEISDDNVEWSNTGKKIEQAKKLAQICPNAKSFEEEFLRHWQWCELLDICDNLWFHTLDPKDIINLMREPAVYDDDARAAKAMYSEDMKYDSGPICGCVCFEGHVLVLIGESVFYNDDPTIDTRGYFKSRAYTRNKKHCVVIWKLRDDYAPDSDADAGYACNWRKPFAVVNDQGKDYFRHPVKVPKVYRVRDGLLQYPVRGSKSYSFHDIIFYDEPED